MDNGYFQLKFSLWGSSPHGCFFLYKVKKSWTCLHRTLEPLDILEDIPRLDVSDRLQSDIIQFIELATRYRKCQEPLAALVPLSKIKSFFAFCKISNQSLLQAIHQATPSFKLQQYLSSQYSVRQRCDIMYKCHIL